MPKSKMVTLARCFVLMISLVIFLSSVSYSVENVASPLIVRKDRQVITHMNKVVPQAVPGDSIEYIADYSNVGDGAAKNVAVVFTIPKGTTYLAKSVSVKTGPAPKEILVFDKSKKTWAKTYSTVENVSMVKCLIDTVAQKTKGMISIKVIVNE